MALACSGYCFVFKCLSLKLTWAIRYYHRPMIHRPYFNDFLWNHCAKFVETWPKCEFPVSFKIVQMILVHYIICSQILKYLLFQKYLEPHKFSVQYYLVELYKVCSNNIPKVKIASNVLKIESFIKIFKSY